MEQLKDPGVILGSIDLIAIGVVYAHLQKQISSLKQQGVKAEGIEDIRKNINILDQNIKSLNDLNVNLLNHVNKLTSRVDKLESANIVNKGDSKTTKKKTSKKVVSSDESEPEQTDEDLVVSMARRRIQSKSPN